MQLLAALG